MSPRKIIHVDMDAFFASVEQRDRPELRGLPVIVGGDPKSRAVVCAASYEVRRFGVKSGMPCSKAYRLCPQAIFIPPDFKKYSAVSQTIRSIFLSITPKVEPLALDEAFLDVTTNLLNEPLAMKLAKLIKDKIFAQTGLTASAGVGPNKFIAKLASDLKKPDGLVVIPPEKVAAFVERLPVEQLWGVGPATTTKLHALGIYHTGQLREASLRELEGSLGSFASFLHGLARGEDNREVETDSETKSCGSETTFAKDLLDHSEIAAHISRLVEEVCEELERIERPAKTFTLKVRYNDFSTITRSRALPFHTQDPADVWLAMTQLIEKTEIGSRPVRLVGVSAHQLLSESEWIQLWFDFAH